MVIWWVRREGRGEARWAEIGGSITPPNLQSNTTTRREKREKKKAVCRSLTHLRDVRDEEGVVQEDVGEPGDARAGGANGAAGHGDEAAVWGPGGGVGVVGVRGEGTGIWWLV